jgi:8-oxo-dGTP diphosphatase
MVERRTIKRRQRVYAYVTGPRGLLILEHPQHPEAGLQVPGGTIQDGEEPALAVLREVEEETGLSDVRVGSCLGAQDFDMRRFGIDELQTAWYFHLECIRSTPETWYHHEAHSVKEPIPFRFYWSPLPYAGPELVAVHGHMLGALNHGLELGV